MKMTPELSHDIRMMEFLPQRSAYTSPKEHQEPFMLFEQSYCWTMLNEDMSMGDHLKLVKAIPYHEKIKLHLKGLP